MVNIDDEEKIYKSFLNYSSKKSKINWNDEFLPNPLNLGIVEINYLSDMFWFYRYKNQNSIYYFFGIKKKNKHFLRLILKPINNIIFYAKSKKIYIKVKKNQSFFDFLRKKFKLRLNKKSDGLYYILLGEINSEEVINNIIKLMKTVIFDINMNNQIIITDLADYDKLSNLDNNLIKNEFKKELDKFNGIITKHDIINIKPKYQNFYEELQLDNVIEKHNDDIINSEKSIILKEFREELSNCDGLINESDAEVYKSRYNKNYFNFYDELNFDKKIENHNNAIINRERSIILKEFREELSNCNAFINESDAEVYKSRYNKDYFNFYDELNFDKKITNRNKVIIKQETSIILNEFREELSNCNAFINESDAEVYKSRYNKDYFNFYDELNFDKKITNRNKVIIKQETSIILNEFREELSNCNAFINESDAEVYKSRYNKDYFNFYDELNLDKLISNHNNLIIENEKRKIIESFEGRYVPQSEKNKIKDSLFFDWDLDKEIDNHNDKFIENQMKVDNDFFDNVAGISLDRNQRAAVLTDDDNTQIVAGAGTGKTLTIQAKVKYLIEKQGVSPEDILCISFSNSARDDLALKLEKTIGNSYVDVRTFHSLGYSILGINGHGREVPDYEISGIIDNYFKENMDQNSEFIKEIVEFFCYYYNIVYIGMDNLKLETFKSKLTTLNEYDEYLSQYLQIDDFKKTKEYVGTVSELIVANYLFIHNINYEYYKQACFKYQNYDKYIKKYFSYLFAAENDNIPYDVKLDLVNSIHADFDCKKYDCYPSFYLPDEDIYIDLTSIKQDNHKENFSKKRAKINEAYKTKLISVFDYGEDIDGLLEDINNKLTEYQVEIDNRGYEKLFEKLILEDRLPEYNRFIQTVESFINLFKGNSKNIDDYGRDISEEMFEKYRHKNSEKFSGSFEKRNNFFLTIIEKVYNIYTEKLKENNFIDFNDMINDAIIELKNGAEIHEYKYVIVDEYQDTSYTRYRLLQEIQNSTGAKIVVVGDDWQSIYGFTGCDVNLFSQFDEYFENPKMVKINITRRNSQKLIDISGKFIQKNKNQIPKKLKSDKINKSPIKIFEYVSRSEEVLALIKILEDISKQKKDAKILILGRNNYDIYEVVCNEIFKTTSFKDYTTITYENKPDLNIEFRTVHKSKGLEADYVIILNLNNQITGFPNKIVDDSVLNFVNNKQNENIDYPEERRLFYVALTRTKNDVYLFANSEKPSTFVNEIRNKKGVEKLEYSFSNDEIRFISQLLQKKFEVIETDVVCPKCKSGKVNLIVNNEKGTSYFRCSNFCGWKGAPYYNKNWDDGTRKISYVKYVESCPRKGCQGIRIVKKGPYGLFLGCTSHPDCDSRPKHLKLRNKNIDNILFDVESDKMNITRFGVYYLSKYIPEEKRENYDKKDDVEFSRMLIEYKNSEEYSVSRFTEDLIKLISQLSTKKIKNVSKLALIAVPSSKVYKIKSPMKKTIDYIENAYKTDELKSEFNCDKEIINYKDLLKRVKDVPTAHKGEGRASCEQHIDSIKCMEENLSNENIAYIILDDITTTGRSMMACNEILHEKGVKMENIYNIAIGATVRDENEEI